MSVALANMNSANDASILPADVIIYISKFLKYEDILQLCSIHSSYCKLRTSPEFWKSVIKLLYPHVVVPKDVNPRSYYLELLQYRVTITTGVDNKIQASFLMKKDGINIILDGLYFVSSLLKYDHTWLKAGCKEPIDFLNVINPQVTISHKGKNKHYDRHVEKKGKNTIKLCDIFSPEYINKEFIRVYILYAFHKDYDLRTIDPTKYFTPFLTYTEMEYISSNEYEKEVFLQCLKYFLLPYCEYKANVEKSMNSDQPTTCKILNIAINKRQKIFVDNEEQILNRQFILYRDTIEKSYGYIRPNLDSELNEDDPLWDI